VSVLYDQAQSVEVAASLARLCACSSGLCLHVSALMHAGLDDRGRHPPFSTGDSTGRRHSRTGEISGRQSLLSLVPLEASRGLQRVPPPTHPHRHTDTSEDSED
jgi:hypothetical protein